MSPTQNKTPVVAAVCDCRPEANYGAHRAPLQEDGSVVAAVCDCRSEANPDAHRAPLQEDESVVAAVCDCRTETNLDAHRALLQEDGSVVAAVCDCRTETNLDAHRAPLQEDECVVAAVCDCRPEANPGAHRAPLQRKTRLTRLDRLFVQHPIYFVTACTSDRRSLLAGVDIHHAFYHFSTAGAARGAWVGRYVLMPDHLHLFVALEAISLSAWMKSLKNALSKTLRIQGHDAPHWQRGFFDHLLRSGESYSQKWDYVRENPVRSGLVTKPEDWPYAGEICDLEYRK